jgi:N-terminal half of MaoC dehydratase
MAPERTHITPQMRDIVGLELRRGTSFPITDSDIRRWAIAVYYPEPAPRLFWDADYAAGTSHGGIVAPEEFNPFAWMTQPDPDREERSDPAPTRFVSAEETLGVEPAPVTNLINGGSEVDYGVRMQPGDVITSVTRLAAYSEREGRLGLMLFTTTEDTWTNQRSETVRTSRSTLIRY